MPAAASSPGGAGIASRTGRRWRELKRPGVNLMVLWEEYREADPVG
jgi:hypothetical protein